LSLLELSAFKEEGKKDKPEFFPLNQILQKGGGQNA